MSKDKNAGIYVQVNNEGDVTIALDKALKKQ